MRISDWSSDVCSSDLVTGDVTGQVNPGEVASDTAGRVTQPVGDVVGQTDDMVNDTADSANLKLATQDQVRAGAHVTDMTGNSRSEESRVGKECVRPSRSRRTRDH